MKKVAFMLVVVMLLLISSTVALAAQPYEVPSEEESVQTTDIGINTDKKWVEVSKFYGPGQSVPSTIMYDSGGYTGVLYFQGGFVYRDGFMVDYAGWVYSGSVMPWSFTNIK